MKSDYRDQVGVSAKPGVGSNKLKVLGNSLGNEQPVEWVPVMQWQPRHRCRMDGRYKQFMESASFHLQYCVIGVGLDFADAGFDGDLPDAY